MANLRDLGKKAIDLFNGANKAVSAPFNQIRSDLQNVNQQIPQNQGPVRRFIQALPVAIQSSAQNLPGPAQATGYAQNRIAIPAMNTAKNTFNAVNPFNHATLPQRGISVANAGLSGLQTTFNATPGGLLWAGYDAYKGAGVAKKTGGNTLDNMSKGFTGEKQFSAGQAFAPKGQEMAYNAAEFAAPLLHGGVSALVERRIAKSLKNISMHPEDVNALDRAVGVMRDRKADPNTAANAKDYLYKLAEHYLPKKELPEGGSINTIISKLQKVAKNQDVPYMSVPGLGIADNKPVNGKGSVIGRLTQESQTPQSTTLPPSLKNGSTTSLPSASLTSQNGTPNPAEIARGFTTSVQEAPNVSGAVKPQVSATYTPKPNTQLMGEAQALLQDGAKINFKNVKNVDNKVAATIQEAISQDAAGNHEAAANLFNNLAEQGTELGRGVQAFSLLQKMSPEAVALSAAGKINKYNQTASTKIPQLTGEQQQQISGLVTAIRGMADGREKNIAMNELQKTINGFIPSSIVDKALTVWKAGLLTSLRTHERNLVGNTIMSGAEVAKDAPASIADRLMSLKTGKRSLTLSTQGTAGGVKEGLGAAKDIVKMGYDPEQTIAKFDQKNITWGNNPLEKALKAGTDAVFRTLGGEDKPFLHGATARSLYDQAKTEAINAGQQGNQDFIHNLIAHPTEQMKKVAEIDANYATFHDKNMLSDIASGIKRAASKPVYGKWGELGKAVTEVLAPFTGVPSSIVGKTIDYSPIGLAKGMVNVGRVLAGQVPEMQRQAAQELGRGVIGTGLFGLGAYLMSKGVMTGQPKDAKEADLWAAQGQQANSIFIGGKWRSINSIGPQNLVMLAGAKYQEEMGKPDGSAGAYAASLGKDQLSQTFLQGVQGPLNAISDPKRFAKNYIGNQAASTVPNIVKDASKAFDPSQRENNNIQDYFTNSIPGLRNKNIEKRDVLGNVMKQEPTGPAAFVDLFNSKKPISNPVLEELARLNAVGESATPSKIGKSQTIRGVKQTLTPDALNKLESQAGPQVTQALNELIQNPSYQKLPDDEKANAISNIVSQQRKTVKNSTGPSTSSPVGKKIYTADGKSIDLSPPTTGQGIDAFTNQNWNLTKARDIYKADLTPQQKQDAYKQLSVNPSEVEYDYKATHSTDVKTQYILSKANSMPHDALIQELLTGRVVSSSGSQFAANGVIDNLFNQGTISKEEQVALKKIKTDKNGKSLLAAGAGKKPKKMSIKIAASKAPKTSTFKLKLSKAPKKISKNTFKISKSKQPKIAKYKIAKGKTSFSTKYKLTG